MERKEKRKREIVRGNEEDWVGGQVRERKRRREKEGETERHGQPHTVWWQRPVGAVSQRQGPETV